MLPVGLNRENLAKPLGHDGIFKATDCMYLLRQEQAEDTHIRYLIVPRSAPGTEWESCALVWEESV